MLESGNEGFHVRMDETQRGWAMASLAILAISTAFYTWYALTAPQGPRGGSAIGLVFGNAGFAFMLFAALLGARKRVPVWRLGRAQAWMRGHLWLGLLSLPLILFHSGFHFGGALTCVALWLLIITVVSGIYGAALQNYLPRVMTADASLETIYDEIANVRQLLREEADRSMETLCGNLCVARGPREEIRRAGGSTAVRTAGSGSQGAAVAAAAEILLLTDEESVPLRRFYLEEMRPFLEHSRERGQRLANPDKTKSTFAGLKTLLPAAAAGTLDDLQDICEEARQLSRQERLHHWLHGWLLLHIPISLALILLVAVHAIMALRY